MTPHPVCSLKSKQSSTEPCFTTVGFPTKDTKLYHCWKNTVFNGWIPFSWISFYGILITHAGSLLNCHGRRWLLNGTDVVSVQCKMSAIKAFRSLLSRNFQPCNSSISLSVTSLWSLNHSMLYVSWNVIFDATVSLTICPSSPVTPLFKKWRVGNDSWNSAEIAVQVSLPSWFPANADGGLF